MQLNEDFLHYIWKYRLLTRLNIYTSRGDRIRIIAQGQHNTNAGPDFSLAKLFIGEQLWIGNVEIHLKASDWVLHGHHTDKVYDSVILHAVYEDDHEIHRTDGTLIPVLVLKGLIPEELFQHYQQLLAGRGPFPCAKLLHSVEDTVKGQMLSRMVEERLMERTADLQQRMERSRYDWNGILYYLLLRGFGFKINSVPFEILADTLQLRILLLHRDNPLQLNALLFGMAGFLEADFIDTYPKALQTEYRFLKKKYTLNGGDQALWKFMRIRPQNFPVLRIAQLAALLSSGVGLFTEILDCRDGLSIKKQFSFSLVHPYWKNHSHFDQLCKNHAVEIGKNSLDSLIINAVCLFLYCYGRYYGKDIYQQRAIFILKSTPIEHNALISVYTQAGFKPQNAFDTQALLQLNRQYCVNKKCLQCAIGNALMGNKCTEEENNQKRDNKNADL